MLLHYISFVKLLMIPRFCTQVYPTILAAMQAIAQPLKCIYGHANGNFDPAASSALTTENDRSVCAELES